MSLDFICVEGRPTRAGLAILFSQLGLGSIDVEIELIFGGDHDPGLMDSLTGTWKLTRYNKCKQASEPSGIRPVPRPYLAWTILTELLCEVDEEWQWVPHDSSTWSSTWSMIQSIQLLSLKVSWQILLQTECSIDNHHINRQIDRQSDRPHQYS